MPKRKKNLAKPVMTISNIVDQLEKASTLQSTAVGNLGTRLKDVCSKASTVKLREEQATESNLASRLAKVLHTLTANTTRIDEITTNINL